MDNGYRELIPVDLTVSIWVEQQFFFGHLAIKKVSGFKDEQTGALITNAFTTGIIDPNEIWDTWQRINSIDDAPQKPVMIMKGLIGYDAEGET